MTKRGMEPSVTAIFEHELRASCSRNGVDDLSLALNSGDRKLNADNMFTVCDRFFIVEMKSRIKNIQDESKKRAVYRLCEGLIAYPAIRRLHRQCHYILWGEEIMAAKRVETRYSIYEDSVCRPSILPKSTVLVEPSSITTSSGNSLADGAAAGTTGLTKPDFFHYLAWLLSDRKAPSPSFSPTAQLPIALIGNSAGRSVYGQIFNTYSDFDTWADEALQNRINQRGY